MKQSKFKQVMKEAVKNSWIYKIFVGIFRNKEKEKIITRGDNKQNEKSN